MESLHYYVASRFIITFHRLLLAHPSPCTMATANPNNLSNDVTMESVLSEIRTLKADLTALQAERSYDLSLDARSRERTRASTSSRPHNVKIIHFSNLPGENFLAWRSQFQVIADYHRWTDEEVKQLAYYYMNGTAL